MLGVWVAHHWAGVSGATGAAGSAGAAGGVGAASGAWVVAFGVGVLGLAGEGAAEADGEGVTLGAGLAEVLWVGLAVSGGVSCPLHPVSASAVRVRGSVMRVMSFMVFLWVGVAELLPAWSWVVCVLFCMVKVLHSGTTSAKRGGRVFASYWCRSGALRKKVAPGCCAAESFGA